jgi:fucose permease
MTTRTVNELRDQRLIHWLTCLTFFTFAMTTDAVGGVIPGVIEQFRLSMRAGFVPAAAIAFLPLAGLAANRLLDPAKHRLQNADRDDYATALASSAPLL